MSFIAACLVTRGDVDLEPVLSTIPPEWDVVIWNNAVEDDAAVMGRYLAIDRTEAEVIYVQDDDCVIADPMEVVKAWSDAAVRFGIDVIACNMPPEFRPHYSDTALVGFGAAFHRDTPGRAFDWFTTFAPGDAVSLVNRTCDVIVTGLSKCAFIDVPKVNLPVAFDDSRMWRQESHIPERARMLDIVRQVRRSA